MSEWQTADRLDQLVQAVEETKALHRAQFGARHGYRHVYMLDTPDAIVGLADLAAAAVPKLQQIADLAATDWQAVALIAGLESAVLAGPAASVARYQRIGPGQWRIAQDGVWLLGHPQACERLARITLAAAGLAPFAGVDIDGDGEADEYWLREGADGRLRPEKAEP